MQRPDAIGAVSVDLWERLAFGLIPIIGEGGFQSLYARSIHLIAPTFPWMRQKLPPAGESRFSGLKLCLDGHDADEAGEASTLLLTTLIDILILLIGELLTTSILSSAWGDDVFDTAGKELHP